MTTTIKRVLGKSNVCEEAEGDYCYCRCLGTFHGVSHKKIRDRESELKTKKENLDKCTCEYQGKKNQSEKVYLHKPTKQYFRVCKVCGGRIFLAKDELELQDVIQLTTSGVKVKNA